MGDLIINIENGTSLPFRSNTFHACFGGLLRYEHGGIFFGCFLCHSSKAHWTFFGIVSCGPNIYFGSKESAFVAAVSFSVAGSGAGAVSSSGRVMLVFAVSVPFPVSFSTPSSSLSLSSSDDDFSSSSSSSSSSDTLDRNRQQGLFNEKKKYAISYIWSFDSSSSSDLTRANRIGPLSDVICLLLAEKAERRQVSMPDRTVDRSPC